MVKNKLIECMKNGNYTEILDLTNNSKDIDELFMRAIAFGLSNSFDEAINVIQSNEKILSKNLSKLIDVHMDLCFWANRLVEAQEALIHYNEYPYESQEVEEKLTFYKKETNKHIASLGKTQYSEDEILKLLTTDKEEQIQIAINELKKYDVEPFINSIKRILVNSKISGSTRCLSLILLFEKKYSHEVSYYWHDKTIKVIPSQLVIPFKDQKFIQLMQMKNDAKDVAYSETFETLMATYYLYVFPFKVDNDIDDLFAAFDIVTRKYIGWPINKMRQKPQVELLINEIEAANTVF